MPEAKNFVVDSRSCKNNDLQVTKIMATIEAYKSPLRPHRHCMQLGLSVAARRQPRDAKLASIALYTAKTEKVLYNTLRCTKQIHQPMGTDKDGPTGRGMDVMVQHCGDSKM